MSCEIDRESSRDLNHSSGPADPHPMTDQESITDPQERPLWYSSDEAPMMDLNEARSLTAADDDKEGIADWVTSNLIKLEPRRSSRLSRRPLETAVRQAGGNVEFDTFSEECLNAATCYVQQNQGENFGPMPPLFISLRQTISAILQKHRNVSAILHALVPELSSSGVNSAQGTWPNETDAHLGGVRIEEFEVTAEGMIDLDYLAEGSEYGDKRTSGSFGVDSALSGGLCIRVEYIASMRKIRDRFPEQIGSAVVDQSGLIAESCIVDVGLDGTVTILEESDDEAEL
jgi:hypothetical protein